jgi:hypothetical protein
MNGPDASTYFNMAYIYDHIYGDPFKAIKFYREYLTLKPEAADLYEVEQRIESLERGSKVKSPETLKNFNVNMDNLKF